MTAHSFNGHYYQYVSILDFIQAKDDGGGGDNWSCKTCSAPVKSSSLNNTKLFTDQMLLLSLNCQFQSTIGGKVSHSTLLLTPDSPGVFEPYLWPLKAPGYLGVGCQACYYFW